MRRLGRLIVIAAGLIVVMVIGRTIGGMVDAESASAPFERAGSIDEPLEIRAATVSVGAVEGSTLLDDGRHLRVSPGVWVVAEVTITATAEPTRLSYAALRDEEGRVFEARGRNFWSPGHAQPGVQRKATVAIEVPQDAAAGAALLLATRADHRGDDLAVIDLGVTAERAAAWAARDDPIRVEPAAERGS